VDAGGMRDRITIEANTPTREGSFNSKVANWRPIGPDISARVDDVPPARGNSETNANNSKSNTRKRTVSIRWRADLTTAMRLKVRGETVYYAITGMNDVGYRDQLDLSCEEFRS
jgi:head-tail adaptor